MGADLGMFNSITPEMLDKIAMQLNPKPILAELGAQMPQQQMPMMPSSDLSGTGRTDGQVQLAEDPIGYAGALGMTQDPKNAGGAPKAAPFDPRSAMALQAMMPKQQQPHFAPAPGVRQPVPITLHVPDVSNLVKINLGQQGQQAMPPTLAHLLRGQ